MEDQMAGQLKGRRVAIRAADGVAKLAAAGSAS
jgi:hypothetical protein